MHDPYFSHKRRRKNTRLIEDECRTCAFFLFGGGLFHLSTLYFRLPHTYFLYKKKRRKDTSLTGGELWKNKIVDILQLVNNL